MVVNIISMQGYICNPKSSDLLQECKSFVKLKHILILIGFVNLTDLYRFHPLPHLSLSI
jgi:hypothetical protein